MGRWIMFSAIFICYAVLRQSAALTPGEIAPKFMINPDKIFSAGKEYYRLLHLDYETNSLYVGAMNRLYRLWIYNVNDTSNRAFFAQQELQPYYRPAMECEFQHMDQKDYLCQNHIRLVAKASSKMLFVCGTNAFQPAIARLDPLSLELLEKGIDGAAICPMHPDGNGTAVWVAHGNPDNLPSIYAASRVSQADNDGIIYRPGFDVVSPDDRYRFLRTMPNNRKWLNDPEFVESFDLGDQYVYFFFREKSFEHSHCGNYVYTRVARICKNDVGGNHMMKHSWVTFLKARLNCSIPGTYPFYFDHLESVEKLIIDREAYFYAVFSTSNSAYRASAVCSFRLSDINALFDTGLYSEQKTMDSVWQPVSPQNVPSPRPGQCVDNTRTITPSTLNFIKSHPLMHESLPGTLVFEKRDTTLSKVTLDAFADSTGLYYTVVFAVSTSGEMYKILHPTVSLDRGELVSIHSLPNKEKINDAKLMHNDFLYIAQDSGVSQISLAQCLHYTDCRTCTHDPYCSWHIKQANCQRSMVTQSYSSDWLQFGTSMNCPTNIVQSRKVLYAGDTLHIECPGADESGDAPIYWTRNNEVLDPLFNKQVLFTTQSGLIIMNVSSSDAGKYVCSTQQRTLVNARVIVDEKNCQGPPSKGGQEYGSIYREWCKEFQEYKNVMLEWRNWYEEQNDCRKSESVVELEPGVAENKITGISSAPRETIARNREFTAVRKLPEEYRS